MAAAFIQQCANGTDATSSNIAPVALTAGVSAGHTIVLFVAMDNASSTTPRITAIDKPAGETATWSMAARFSSGATSSAGSCVMLEAWTITTTQAWSSGFNATAYFDVGSITKKAWVALDFTGITGLRVGVALSQSGSYAQSDSSAAAGELIVGASAWENSAAPSSDTDTTNGSWSTQYAAFTTGGGAASNVALGVQYKIPTAAGTQQFDATGANDGGGIYLAFTTAPTVTGSAALSASSALSAAGQQGLFAAAPLTQGSTLTVAGTIGAPTYFGTADLVQGNALGTSAQVTTSAGVSLSQASALGAAAVATAAVFTALPCTLTIRQKTDVTSSPDNGGDAYAFSLPVAGLPAGGSVVLSVTAVSVAGATNVPYVVYCADLTSYQTHYGYANPTSSTTTFRLTGVQNGDVVSGYIQAHVYASDVYGAVGQSLTLSDVSLAYVPAPPLPGQMSLSAGSGEPYFPGYPMHAIGS